MNKNKINTLSWDQFLGLDQTHLCSVKRETNLMIHQDASHDWEDFKELGKKEALQIEIISSFRSFTKQLQIWNAKALGDRVVLDKNSRPLNIKNSKEEDIFWAILKWSALPGLSRHHWGTDLDICDQNALIEFKEKHSKDYEVQLTPDEYGPQGLFSKLGNWLDQNKFQNFYRPYQKDLGGVAMEPWHLSHIKVSTQFMEFFDKSKFKDILKSEIYQDLIFKDLVVKNIDFIIENYFNNITSPP